MGLTIAISKPKSCDLHKLVLSKIELWYAEHTNSSLEIEVTCSIEWTRVNFVLSYADTECNIWTHYYDL